MSVGDASTSDVAISVNGEPRTLPGGTTAADLVGLLGLRPETVAVEIGGRLVPKASRGARVLADGDRVEIVTLVGGG
ncbi:MAG: sulfur carrier protein ThiS [Planctomycetota bacterium]